MIPVRFPWLYGYSWTEPYGNARCVTIIAMPIPLNLIAKAARGAWGRMRYPARWMKFGDESAAYAAGRRAGIFDRITDEDIATFLLRKKINEVNQVPKADDFWVSMAAYHRQMSKQLLESMAKSSNSIYRSPSEVNRMTEEAHVKVNWGVIKKI